MNRLPQNVLLNFPLELPKSDLTIYLSSGISEISYQMVSTQRREILLSFEAGLSVSKEIPYNKHKGHFFLGFRALHSQVFSWPAALHWPVGIIYRILPLHLPENA